MNPTIPKTKMISYRQQYCRACCPSIDTQRNSMLHFGSNEGAEMAATYHSIISAVKM